MKVADKPSLEELAHFGVKGQRWGVRKKRDTGGSDRKAKPDPKANFNVSVETRRKRDAKAAKFEKRSAEFQQRIDAGNKKIAELENQPKSLITRVKLSNLKQDQKILEEQKVSADKHAQAKREGRLTPTQKKLLIGGAVVGGLLVAGVAAQQLNSGQLRQNINRGREIITGKKFKFKEAPELKGNWSADQISSLVVPDINEGYPTAIGSGMNCRRCTFAYEMRRRGLDVAATRTPNGQGQNAIGMFNVLDTTHPDVSQTRGMKILQDPWSMMQPDNSPAARIMHFAQNTLSENKIDHPDNIFSVLSKQPERSRGELGVFWDGGGGHSMAYEVINGIPHIFDCQTGERYSSADDIAKKLPAIAAAGFTRLDNKTIDPSFIQRWVKNVK